MILIKMMMSFTLFRLSDQSDSGLKTNILDSDHFGFLLEMYKARIFANITNEGETETLVPADTSLLIPPGY